MDQIDLSGVAMDWAILLADNTSFGKHDVMDADLFSSDSGTITFVDGSLVSFDGVEGFRW